MDQIYTRAPQNYEPLVIDGYDRTIVPLRPIFDTFGGGAIWDATARTATCVNNINNVRYRYTVDSFNVGRYQAMANSMKRSRSMLRRYWLTIICHVNQELLRGIGLFDKLVGCY